MRRRDLLWWGVAGLANLAVAAMFTIPVVGYLAGPLYRRRAAGGWSLLGPAARFRGGRVHRVEVEVISGSGYTPQRQQRVVYVTEVDRELVAFRAECPHMGCNVSWEPARKRFDCPCHDGAFGQDGRVLGGPPPRPLARYPVRIVKGRLEARLEGGRS